ncbi:MAG: 50S ribosomal protein L11 methyltransferase [Burkholderiaceae bacterium]
MTDQPSPAAPAPGEPRWLETLIEVARDHADRLSDALLEHGALSVQVDDADADTELEQPVFGEPGMPAPVIGWQRSRLTILTETDADVGALVRAACADLGLDCPPIGACRPVHDQDWVSLTQAQFEPFPVGQRLWISPSWHADSPAAQGRLRLTIDPGLAFGTGSHPTTHLCLQWLEEHLQAGESVLDYGCGSGILAIAAARLGAGTVVGLDIDPLALVAAAGNAQINGAQVGWLGPDDGRPAQAAVVVANILASPLKVLAPLLEQLVAPGGALVLAGLLDHQAGEVAACYRTISMRPWRSREGWTCLSGRRR